MDPEDYPELEHAPYSPSTLKYFALCPSWKSGDSEEVGEEAAQRGAIIHKAFETGDLSLCETDEDKAIAQKALAYVNYIKRLGLARSQRNSRNHS